MLHYMSGHGWGMGMGWGWIIGVIILAAIIFLAIKGTSTTNGSTRPNEKTPLDILKERYAKGEIDREEFLARKKDLE